MNFKNILYSLLISGCLYGSTAGNISMFTETYPPYNMKEDGKLTGLSIEILKAVLKQLNSKQTIEDVLLTNWSRAYSIALKNNNSMVFSTTRTESREPLFKWVGPIVNTKVGAIALKDKKITINSIEDFNKYKIGAVLKDVGETTLAELGVNSQQIQSVSGENAINLSFLKLQNKRIDIFAYETKAAFENAKKLGFDTNKYEIIYTLKEGDLYFAFNKNTDDEIIQKWQKALDTIKDNGIYNKILLKYIH